MQIIAGFFGVISFLFAYAEFRGLSRTSPSTVGILWIVNGLALLLPIFGPQA